MLIVNSPIRVAVFCSHRAPGIDELLDREAATSDWKIVCAIASEPVMKDRALFERAGIPVLEHPIRQFHRERRAALHDLEVRRSFDALVLETLRDLDVQLVLLLGYLYVVTDVILEAFTGRVLNLHDSDLSLEDPRGERLYTGLRSTLDAILAGEPETRSTLHLVTPALDGGPILARSRRYPVAPFVLDAAGKGHRDIVKAYAWAQREWMMRDSWGEMAAGAIGRFAARETLTEFPARVARAREHSVRAVPIGQTAGPAA